MNEVDAVLASNTKFQFYSCSFYPHTATKHYNYKTTLDLEVGDEVLVETPSGELKVVRVEAVVDILDLTPGIRYKWILQKVDRSVLENCRAVERDVAQALAKSRAREQLAQIRAQLPDSEDLVKLVRL